MMKPAINFETCAASPIPGLRPMIVHQEHECTECGTVFEGTPVYCWDRAEKFCSDECKVSFEDTVYGDNRIPSQPGE